MRIYCVVFFLFLSMPFYAQEAKSLPTEKIEKKAEEGCFPTVNGIIQKGILKVKKEQFRNMVIGYYINRQNKAVSEKAISFGIKIPGVQAEQVKGSKIDERMYQKILRTASKGDMITFFDIKRDMKNSVFNGIYCDVTPPLVLEIY